MQLKEPGSRSSKKSVISLPSYPDSQDWREIWEEQVWFVEGEVFILLAVSFNKSKTSWNYKLEEEAHKNSSIRREEQQRKEDFVEIRIVQNIIKSDGDEEGTSTPVATSTSASTSKINLSFYEEHNKSSDNQNEKPVDGGNQ